MGWYHEKDSSGAISGYGCWFGAKADLEEKSAVQPLTLASLSARNKEPSIVESVRQWLKSPSKFVQKNSVNARRSLARLLQSQENILTVRLNES